MAEFARHERCALPKWYPNVQPGTGESQKCQADSLPDGGLLHRDHTVLLHSLSVGILRCHFINDVTAVGTRKKQTRAQSLSAYDDQADDAMLMTSDFLKLKS